MMGKNQRLIQETLEKTSMKKKGLTLIELLISIAIIAVVITAAFSLNIFGIKTFNSAEAKSGQQFDVRMAADFITKQVRNAKSVEISNNLPVPANGYYDLYLDHGKIVYYKNGVLSSIPGVSGVSDFTLIFSKASDNMLYFKVGKLEESEYDIESTIEILNISSVSPYKIQSSDSSGKVCIRFTVEELNDQQAVEADKSWLSIPNMDSITGNIYLPTEGPNGTNISWTSANPSIISSDGIVKRPSSSDASIVLTATISKGVESQSKQFNATVKQADISAAISNISDINVSVNQYETFTMPQTLQAIMSDNSIRQFPVTWVPSSIDTGTAGVKTSIGSVAGYSSTVKLNVTVVGISQPLSIVSKSLSNDKYFTITFNKDITSVNIQSNYTGSSAIPTTSGKDIKIEFATYPKNNTTITIKVNSKSGESKSYTFRYKNNEKWSMI